jgi:hypothetical protein
MPVFRGDIEVRTNGLILRCKWEFQKMRTAKLLLFLVLLSGFSSLSAQTNFLKGYYITTTQDTVPGYIEYRGNGRNFNHCIFKSEKNAEPIDLLPEQIAGYSIEDKVFFESYTITSKRAEPFAAFLEVLINGRLSLLRYEDNYFARASDDKIVDISSRNEIVDHKIKKNQKGLGLLKVLMNDCSEMTGPYIEQRFKSNQNLIELFQQYNACVGSALSNPPGKLVKPQLDFGVHVSPTLTGMEFNSSTIPATFERDPTISFGITSSIFLPSLDERIRLVMEITYMQYTSYAYFSSLSTNNDLFVDYSILRMPLMGRISSGRLFFEAGLQNQFIIKQSTKWRIETLKIGHVETTEGELIPINKWNIGFIAGAGIGFSVLDRQARSSVRFSQTYDLTHDYHPKFRILELNISIDLTK